MGRVIFSFDFELGWGDITNGVWRQREANGVYKKLRRVLPDMLDTMDLLEFSATWATVGAMIESPQFRDFSYLTDAQREIVENGVRVGEAETFDGVDLFEMVLTAKTEHQIACHSYAHIPFDFSGVDSRFVCEDLQRFNQVLAKYEQTTNRFVFPENTEDYYLEIAEKGFKKARVSADNYFSNRFLYLLTLAIIPPPASKEKIDKSGVTKHYGSMLFNDAGNAHRIPLLERRLQLGLNNVISRDHDLHIWAHPFNFAESEGLFNSFKKMVKKIAILRDEGKLVISHM